MTGTGHLRSLSVSGSSDRLEELAATFAAHNLPSELWALSGSKTKLAIHESLLPLIDPQQFILQAVYHTAAVKQSISYQNPYKEVRLGKDRKIVVERRQASSDIALDAQALQAIREGSLSKSPANGSSALLEIGQYEQPGSGLLDYF